MRLHAAQIERAIANLLWTIRLGVDDAVGVAIASAIGFVEQLGSVERKREALHAFDQHFVFALFQIVDVDCRHSLPEAVRTSPEWAWWSSR